MLGVKKKIWNGNAPPEKILIIRFQALGDTVITLPYIQSLKRQYPKIKLHFLTRKEVCPIPACVGLFEKVIAIGGKRNAKVQFLLSLLKLPWLFFQRYDAVIDLQNHKISRIVRKFLFVRSWTEFEVDRRTTLSAGERTKQAIEALWTWKVNIDGKFRIQSKTDAIELLKRNGWRKDHQLVVLNPAGSFPSRNWPSDNYIEFAKLWLEQINSKTQFVLLLLPTLKEKANYIAKELGDSCINLTGNASQVEAFAILQQSTFVLSEDGGLMHMAWVQRVPTLALFSSSIREWSTPLGKTSGCLDSSDLACGPCQLFVCKYEDNRCLTRYSPTFVLLKSKELLSYHL